jgi:hypothetical protein
VRGGSRHVIVAWALVMASASEAQESPAVDAQFRTSITAFYAASARGDTAAMAPQLAADLQWVIGATGGAVTKPQLLMAVAGARGPLARFDIDSVRVHLIQNVAVVGYRRTDHRTVAQYEQVNAERVLEVFVRHGGRWLLTRHMQTWIVNGPTSTVALDSAALEPFIGHYEIGRGYVDNVHREGGALVATASGQSEGATLVPVSATAFAPDGVGPLIVFERDATGRVIGYVQGGPDGGVVRARKIQ